MTFLFYVFNMAMDSETTPSINPCSLMTVVRGHDINFRPIISGVESDRKTQGSIIENKKER